MKGVVFFFFFMSTLQYLRLSSEGCGEGLRLSQALQHHKSLLHSQSFFLFFSDLRLLLSPLSRSGQSITLVWPLALSGPLSGRLASIAAARGSCIIFMSSAAVQGIIFIPAADRAMYIRGWSVNLIYLAFSWQQTKRKGQISRNLRVLTKS